MLLQESLENDVKTLEENLRNLQSDQVDGMEHGAADIENLKKHVDEVGEKIRQLEGINNQNADVINKFTVNHITYNEKFDKVMYLPLPKHTYEYLNPDNTIPNRLDATELFYKNRPTPASFLFIFGLFKQTNNTIYTTNQCEKMSKCPSSI